MQRYSAILLVMIYVHCGKCFYLHFDQIKVDDWLPYIYFTHIQDEKRFIKEFNVYFFCNVMDYGEVRVTD